MRSVRWPILLISLGVFVLLSTSGAMADSRINVWHHFGGDVLYCTHEQGCWMLNMHGQPLWSVPQATIDAAMAKSCASSSGETIHAGQGTYGPMYLVVYCPDNISLIGSDEWGKQNTMPFKTDYLPINPASTPGQGGTSNGKCSVDLASNHFDSYDGIHHRTGFDIWAISKKDDLGEFLHWSSSDEGKPPCDLSSA